MKTKPCISLGSFFLITAALVAGTTSMSGVTQKAMAAKEKQRSDEKIAPAAQDEFATIEPIVVLFGLSPDGITTGSPAQRCLHGKHFDSVIFISEGKDIKPGNVTVIARTLETKFGKLEYDPGLAQQLGRMSDLKLAFESRAQLESPAKEHLAQMRRILGEFKAVVLMVNFENLAQAERLGEALAEVTFGNNILIAGMAGTDVDARNLPEAPNRRVLAYDDALEQFAKKELTTDKEKKLYGSSQHIAKALHSAARALGYNHLLLESRVSGERELSTIDVFAYKPLTLSEAEKDSLLKVARKSLEEHVRTGKMAKVEVTDDALLKREAGFVTLTEDGDLRGCIGTIFPHVPIAEVVNTNAVRAAVSDPRFPRVTATELEKIKVEVTMFTSRMKRVRKIDEIEVGRDGLYMRKGYNSGIFLPQVPVQFGWDRMQYLQHLCDKAGLPPGAWKDADIYRYTAIHFGEK